MIKINRPAQVPNVLREAGRRRTDEARQLYDYRRGEFDQGSEKFEFDSSVYGHETVKRALMVAQEGKCCYCESKFSATSYGAVEHYRPKGAVRQEKGAGKLFPGYYWLAYEWTNILVSCERCNTSYKGILFPLERPENRARNHHDDLTTESPMFIDPSREDPALHLQFRGEALEPLSSRGMKSIEGYGLRRNGLEEARRERLAILRTLVEVFELQNNVAPDDVSKARELLEWYRSDEADYSAMARSFLQQAGFF